MVANVEISRADLKDLERTLSGIKNGAKKAMVTSINGSLVSVRAKAVKDIGTELNLKAARIRQDFRIEKASYSRIKAAVRATGQPVGLATFNGTKELARGGVSVKVLKRDKPSKLLHAFIRTAKTAKNVFERIRKPGVHYGRPMVPGRKYGAMPEKYRLPVKRLTGPRVEDIYAEPRIYDGVSKFAAERQVELLGKKVDDILRRGK